MRILNLNRAKPPPSLALFPFPFLRLDSLPGCSCACLSHLTPIATTGRAPSYITTPWCNCRSLLSQRTLSAYRLSSRPVSE